MTETVLAAYTFGGKVYADTRLLHHTVDHLTTLCGLDVHHEVTASAGVATGPCVHCLTVATGRTVK